MRRKVAELWRPSVLLPLGNLVLFVVVATAYVAQHGGIDGDYDISSFGGDTVDDQGDIGLVFFNRWQFGPENSLLTKGFMLANLPALVVSKVLIGATGLVVEELQSPFPFGLSYASYSLILALPLSLLQWFGVGILAESVRERRLAGRNGTSRAPGPAFQTGLAHRL